MRDCFACTVVSGCNYCISCVILYNTGILLEICQTILSFDKVNVTAGCFCLFLFSRHLFGIFFFIAESQIAVAISEICQVQLEIEPQLISIMDVSMKIN